MNLSIESILHNIDSNYTTKSFAFTTKQKAEELLPNSNKVEALPIINLVKILQENKFYIWSKAEQVLIDPVNWFVVASTSTMYADFDGNNDSIEFTNSSDLLDWSKSWTLGITLLMQIQPADGKYLTIFQNGQNRIIFSRGGANMGVYVSYTQAGYSNGANTWYEFGYGDRLLFTYDHTTRQMTTSVHDGTTLRTWTLTVPTAVGAGEPNGKLSLGKPQVDVPNAWGSSKHVYYHGGMNNFIAQTSAMGAVSIAEYFTLSSPSDFNDQGQPIPHGDYTESQPYYGDLTSYCPLGEDVFPAVVDKKGALLGGAMYGGGSFEPIPIPE